MWDTIVEHAKSCVLNNDHCSYFSAEENVGLLFNCVLRLVGATYDGLNYLPLETLTTTQKSQVERLRRYAYENQSQLVPTDVPAAVQFTSVDMQVQPQMGVNFGYLETALPSYHSLVEQSHLSEIPVNVQLIQEATPIGDLCDVSSLFGNFNY